MSKSELEELNEMSKDGFDFMHDMGEDVDLLNQETHGLIDAKVNNSPSQKSNTLKILAGLFAVLALTIFAYFISICSTPQSKLVAQYYNIPPFMESTVQRSGSEQTASITDISSLYNKADFTEVSNRLNGTESGPLVFYKGISEFESGDIEDAIKSFKSAMDTEYKDLAQWHLALSLIAVNQTDAAIIALQEITETDDHYKYTQAKELLQKL